MNVMIFTGAGFCKPLGLPTTSEFEAIINRNCEGNLGKALKGFLGNKFIDIEHVLSTLEIFVHNKSFVKYLINDFTYGDGNMDSWNMKVRDSISNFRSNAQGMLNEIKSSLFEVLTMYDSNLASKQYSNLIRELRREFPKCCISFFTTNYDLTFEDIQDDLEQVYLDNDIKFVDYGFTLKNQRNIWDTNKAYRPTPEIIEYKKLHGSLDWNITKGNIIQSGVSNKPHDASKMLLLYPGFKGTPNDEPYKKLDNDLFERLLKSDILLTVGFAFRDDFINNQLEMALKMNPKLKVFCYNPANIKTLPAESKTKNFVEQYHSRFLYIMKGIDGNSETPLNIKEFNKAIQIEL